MIRCIAIKDDGEQCTRKPSSESKNKNYCKQHDKSNQTKKLATIEAVEPWVLLKFPEPDARNGKRYIQKIRTHLNKSNSFSKKDSQSGFIYIFCLAHERKLNYYKIGYTERTVEERLEEWGEKHSALELCACFRVNSNAHQKESLIHLYLAYCRMYRYPNERGFHSVYKLSGEIIQDGQENTDEKERLVAKNKEIEWFCAPLEEILSVVEGILKIKTK